jgi:hypothetical protein
VDASSDYDHDDSRSFFSLSTHLLTNENPVFFPLCSTLLGGIQSMQISTYSHYTWLLVFNWQNIVLRTEVFYRRLKLRFEIVIGTKIITSKRSPESVLDCTGWKACCYQPRSEDSFIDTRISLELASNVFIFVFIVRGCIYISTLVEIDFGISVL